MDHVVSQQGDVLIVSVSKLLWSVLETSHKELQDVSKMLISMNIVDKKNEGRRIIVEYAVRIKGRMQRIAKLLKGIRENGSDFNTAVEELQKKQVHDSAFRVVADEMYARHVKLVSNSFGPPRTPITIINAVEKCNTIEERSKIRKIKLRSDTTTAREFLSLRTMVHLKQCEEIRSISGKLFSISGIGTPKLIFKSDVLSATIILGSPANMFHLSEANSIPTWSLLSWDCIFLFKKDPGSDSLHYKLDEATDTKIKEICATKLLRGELQESLVMLEKVCVGMFLEEFHGVALAIARLHQWCTASVDSSTGIVRIVIWGVFTVDLHAGQIPGNVLILRNDTDRSTVNKCLPEPININDFVIDCCREAKQFRLLEIHNNLTYLGIPSELRDNTLKANVSHGCFVAPVSIYINDTGTPITVNYLLPNGGPLGPLTTIGNSAVVIEHAVQCTFSVVLNLLPTKGVKSDLCIPHCFIHNGIIHVEMPLHEIRIVLKINPATLQAALIRSPPLGGVLPSSEGVVGCDFAFAAGLAVAAVVSAFIGEKRPHRYLILPHPFSNKTSTPISAASICLSHAWIMAWRVLSVCGLQAIYETTILDLILSGGLGDGPAVLQNSEEELLQHTPGITSGHVLVTAVPSEGVYWVVTTTSDDEHAAKCIVSMFYTSATPDTESRLTAAQIRKLGIGSSVEGWFVANLGSLDILMTCALSLAVSRSVTDSRKVGKLLSSRLSTARKFLLLNEVTVPVIRCAGISVQLRLDCRNEIFSTAVTADSDVTDHRTTVLTTASTKVSNHLCTQQPLSVFCNNLSVWVTGIRTLCEDRFLPASLGRWSLGLVESLSGQSLVLSDPHIETDIILLKINESGECKKV